MDLAKVRARRHLVDVIIVLVGRNHKARYKNTAMGIVWAIASPTLFLLTFLFLFRAVFDLKIASYASYAFIGIVAWGWLQGSLNEAVGCISGNANLLVQPRFPSAALPMVAVTGSLLSFVLTFPLLVVILSLDGAKLGVALVSLPLVMAVQFAFLLSLAYFVAALNVTFRDMQYIVPILLQLGYFATPIFYDLKAAPDDVRWILELNPMLHIIDGYRLVLIEASWPHWPALLIVLSVSLALLSLTFRYFRYSSLRFLEEV